jgi:glycosyltransferase involved in cell wall biosynthesis
LAEEQVRDLLRSSDALVLPSRKTPAWEEQFGLVLAEAMAEGTVTVGSKTGAIPEVIGMEELLFEQDDVEGLVAILDRLATDSQFFLDCKRSLWQRARDKFSAERIAVEKVELLQRALRSSTLIGCDAVGVDQELRA